MKRAIAVLLSALSLIACTSCGSKEEVPDIEPQISQMRSICELAVMECYYHNVAKFKEEDASGFWLWKKDKHFWIEYSGIVELGIEASLVEMEVSGDTVSITLPPAEVKNCKVDSASLTEDSFIVDKNSAQIDAEDETAAFAEAQSRMEEAAATDTALLSNAQQRAQALLENYVKNIGSTIGKDYTIQWIFVDRDGNRTGTATSVPAPDGESSGAQD